MGETDYTADELLDALLAHFYDAGAYLAWGYIDDTPLTDVMDREVADALRERYRRVHEGEGADGV